jgi:hypothetical protein
MRRVRAGGRERVGAIAEYDAAPHDPAPPKKWKASRSSVTKQHAAPRVGDTAETERAPARCGGGLLQRVGELGGTVDRPYDADHWRECAENMRAKAEAMTSPTTKCELLQIAVAYDRLADHAERTAGRKAPRSLG